MKNIQKNSILIVFCLIMSFLSALEMQGRIRLVTRDDDNITAFPTITGSLRWAIVDAQDGDTIVIASAVTVISLNANIPIQRNNLIITKIIGNIKITNTGGFDDLQFFNTNPAASSPFIKVTFNNIDFEAFGNIETRAFYAGSDAQNCDVRFVDCSFEKFRLGNDGVVILMVKGDLTLKDCIFKNNQVTGLGGDGIVFSQNQDDTGNARLGPHKLKIIDCEFIDNKVGAGTVYTQARSTTIQWCTFQENQAVSTIGTGAITSQSTQLTITDCVFINNATTNSTGGSGGAIYIQQFDGSENASIERCYFEGNKTAGNNSGGAIFLTNIRPITPIAPSNPFLIRNCTFWKNEAYEGGGIFLLNMQRSIATPPATDIIKRVDIISNTFVGNIARNTNAGTNGGLGASRGGAIFARNTSDCFLDYNVAIENKNTSFPNSKDFVSENGFKTQAGNNVYQTDDNLLVFNTTLTPLSILNSNQTTVTISGFVTPQENGGFSKTFKPDLNSILIGRPPAVGGIIANLPKLDQRLFPRGTTIDVGACEKTPNPTGEIPEGVFMEITACNAINTATANAVKLEWRDRLDLSTDNYIVLRNNVNIATVTKQTGTKQVFPDENPIIGTPVTYQIQANKKTAFGIDKYKSQKATISLFNDAISATDALNDKEVSIYPNPCKEKLFVSLEKTLNLSKENKISIFSIFGQKIISQNIFSQQIEVVLPQNLPAGLYFVEIKQGEKRNIKKIIIE